MINLRIDNQSVEVARGTTILDAAEKLGIEIPTMCFLKGCTPSTSCMVCVVKVNGQDSLVPACASKAAEGMDVQTQTPEVLGARKAALELLLSDHVGDCMGPCHVTCPAKMNIPLMIRQIAEGKLDEAIKTVKKDIPLPAALGRICPAPCENACRRRLYDKSVSICLLKRFVADVDLNAKKPYIPQCQKKKKKRVAIIGAGPAGLSAAYYLLQQGIACKIFDDHDKPGGMLRFGVRRDILPEDVLDAEIAIIKKLGAKFEMNTAIGKDVDLEKLRKKYDAVFLAAGHGVDNILSKSAVETDTDTVTYRTSLPGVFAAPDTAARRKLAVLAVAAGKQAADSIAGFLTGEKVLAPAKPFNSRMGKLYDGEIDTFMTQANTSQRLEPASMDTGFNNEQSVNESSRCLHCDCRKADDCKLRDYSKEYDAKAVTFKAQRKVFTQLTDHPEVIFESGKCINCGLCIDIAAKESKALGLAFAGRGFDVKVQVPFNRSLAEGLGVAAKKCVKACPTGALAYKDGF